MKRSGLALLGLLLATRAEAGSQFFRSAERIDDRQRIVILLAVLVATVLAVALTLVRPSSGLLQRIQLGGSVVLMCLSAVWVAYEARLFLNPFPIEPIPTGFSLFLLIAIMFLLLSSSLSLSLLRALGRRTDRRG